MNKYFWYGITLMFLGQGLIWFQSYGQFIWPFFKRNPLIISLIGIPASYIFIYASKYLYFAFDGLIWPGRLMGFAAGILVFAALTYHIMHEPVSSKTILSLFLAILIVIIQIFL
jgi:hypothetical protein